MKGELRHVRTAPGVDVARCGARNPEKGLLKWAHTHSSATCPGCRVPPTTEQKARASRAMKAMHAYDRTLAFSKLAAP